MTQFAPQGMPFPMMQLPGAWGSDQTQPQFPMPQFPSLPFPQIPGAQQQAMPTLPFSAPFPVPAAPNAQAPSGQQGFPMPFAPFPKPYELYEQTLKNTIKLLRNLLAQSEAARGAANTGAPENANQQNTQGPFPTALMPGLGCQQIPMPQPPAQRQANETGMLPRNDFLGSMLGTVFGASNTDYFYED